MAAQIQGPASSLTNKNKSKNEIEGNRDKEGDRGSDKKGDRYRDRDKEVEGEGEAERERERETQSKSKSKSQSETQTQTKRDNEKSTNTEDGIKQSTLNIQSRLMENSPLDVQTKIIKKPTLNLQTGLVGKPKSNGLNDNHQSKSQFINNEQGQTKRLEKDQSRYISRRLKYKIWQKNNKKCTQCRSQCNLQIDHIKPYALNGKTSEENLRLLCFNCNQRKRIEAGL